MDHRRFAHYKCIIVLGTIGAALCLFIYGANAHNGLIQEMGSAQLLPPSSKLEHFGIRRLLEGETARNFMRLRLMHRHELESLDRPHFVTAGDRIIDFIQVDQMRVMGFLASIHKDHAYTTSTSCENASHSSSLDRHLAPSLSTNDAAVRSLPSSSLGNPSHGPLSQTPRKKHEDFKGRVISGASFPGNIGQYFVEFSVGTPEQRVLFITDTGSDLIWVPCSLCEACVSQSKNSPSSSSFFPKASSTFIPITCSSQECGFVPPPLDATCNERSPTNCTYTYVYTDLSQTTGIFAYDTLAMRSSSKGLTMKIKNVAFGCGTNNAGPSITKVGGVMGLGQGPISFPSQVGHMYGNKFSYCFTSFFHRNSTSTLVFGDDRAGAKLTSPLQFTPFIPSPIVETFYHLQIQEIKLDKEHLSINSSIFEIDKQGSGGVIIDSGTTLTFFLEPAYDVIFQAFKKKIHYPLAPPTAGLHLCYNVSKIDKPRFPRISIIFKGGAIFRPPSRNYFLSPTHEIKCLGFMGSSGLSVLGNLIQQNYYVEYDRFNNQLGFAKASCSTGF